MIDTVVTISLHLSDCTAGTKMKVVAGDRQLHDNMYLCGAFAGIQGSAAAKI